MIEADARLLWELQEGLPIESEPFRVVGERVGLPVADVLGGVRDLMASGQARRLGGVFDARRLGYRSVLCAVDLPEDDLECKAVAICRHPGVTHGYERGWPMELSDALPGGPAGRRWPNFWFTLTALQSDFDHELGILRGQVEPHDLLALPAVRRFKIDVMFAPRVGGCICKLEQRRMGQCAVQVPSADLGPRSATSSVHGASNGSDCVGFIPRTRGTDAGLAAEELTPLDKAVVRTLAGNLPLVERPYAKVAAELGMAEDQLLQRLASWAEQGVLRRVALIVRHRELGFTANGMCVWDVPDEAVVEAGRCVAAAPEVTHCYQRPRTERFPFNLYGMIHTGDWEETRRLFERIGASAGLTGGQILMSQREFKKTSMEFFA